MKIEFQREPQWPPGAWLATGVGKRDEAKVIHGVGVEVHDGWFGEIVWDGPYEAAGFDATDLVYGSGGKLTADSIVFVASSHTMDRLQYLQTDGRWCVSNSLACLLSVVEAGVVPLYRHYRRDFETIILGLDQYRRTLTTTRGDVQLVYQNNLVLRDGKLSAESKPIVERDVSTYDGYRQFLESSLVRCAENMRSPQRAQPYEFLGTISTGFDSPAVAALGRAAGLKHVITFAQARDGFDDDGSKIAELLGLSIEVLDRDRWQDRKFPEVPFLASDAKGEDVYFAGAEELLKRRVLLTGYSAGPWAAKGLANPTLRRADQSGLSLTEYRLRADFINLPVPTMGVQSATQSDLEARAAELAPWASGDSYDKPFCRRLLVESGVPAELFGQENKAASVLVFDRRSMLSPKSRQDFLAHLRAARRRQPLIGSLLVLRDYSLRGVARLAGLGQRACQAMSKIVPRGIVKRLATSGQLQELAYFEPLCDYLFPWAIGHAKQHYETDTDLLGKPNDDASESA